MIVKSTDLISLLPFFVAVGFGTLVVLVDVFHRTDKPRAYVANIAAAGLILTLAAIAFVAEKVPAGSYFGGMLYHDGFTAFLNVLFVIAALVTVVLSPRYIRDHGAERGEYYALVIFATSGMMLMAAAADLLMVFLGLEIMSIAVYVLVGFFRADGRSAEAAAKYFFLGAFASAIFLYGMALMYGTTGGTSLEGIAQAIQASTLGGDNVLVRFDASDALAPTTLDPLFYLGALLLIVGMAFKIALVPFHMWTPDAYTGAPATTVGFMATAVKTAGFAALIRLLFVGLGMEPARLDAHGWVPLLFYLALFTIILGNLMALVQSNVKRMLAYSSIAHAGYALVGVLAAGYFGAGDSTETTLGYLSNSSVLFYLLTYTFATLGAFGCIAYLGSRSREATTYDDFSGIGYRYPAIGLMMAIFMLSSAGLPPTAGFVAKFHVFQTAIVAGRETGDNAFVWLVIIAVLASIAGAYYYLRVIVHMYMRPERGKVPALGGGLSNAALGICAALTLIIGVYPKPFLDASAKAMQDFQGVHMAYPGSGLAQEQGALPAGTNPLPPEEEEKVRPTRRPMPQGPAILQPAAAVQLPVQDVIPTEVPGQE